MTITLHVEMDAPNPVQLKRVGTVSESTPYFTTQSARLSAETALWQAQSNVILDPRMVLPEVVAPLLVRFS